MKKEYIIYKLSESIKSTSRIDNELFTKYNVKRGLRNEDHSGAGGTDADRRRGRL